MDTGLKSTFTFEAQIWRIVCDAKSNLLVAELRNGQTRTLSFIAIDINKKEILWELKGWDWWSGIIGIMDNAIFLHSYRDPKFPEASGIYRVELTTGKQSWEVPKLTFLQFRKDGIVAFEKGSELNRFYLLDALGGNKIKELEADDAMKDSGIEAQSGLLSPFRYLEGEAYFSEVSEFLANNGFAPKESIEYIETDDRIVLCFYQKAGELLQNILLSFDHQGNLILKDILEEKCNGVGESTFFVVNECLVYAREKKEIVILHSQEF